jgi:hypothetical protein
MRRGHVPVSDRRDAATQQLPWAGYFAAGCGPLLVAEVVLTGDVVPALLYLAPLPIGIMALVAPRRGNVERL